MKYGPGICALFLLSTWLPVHAAGSQAPAPSAYQDVMRAQYAARTASQPARPEEAQRIYDAYLRSIGQPAKDRSTNTGDIAAMPPH